MSAYWLKPDGTVVEVDDRHIRSIIANPKIFGLTRLAIEKVYQKHNEPLGGEGNAREEIMVKLIKKGWIRIRFVSRQDSWTIQYDPKSAPDAYMMVETFLNWAIANGSASKYSAVAMIDLKGEDVGIGLDRQVYDIAAGGLRERRKRGTFAAFLNPKRKRRK